VDVYWFVQGTQQTGKLTAEPGSTTFSTKTATSQGSPIANLAVISWEDNYGFPRFDLAFSTRAKCGTDKISDDNIDRPIAGRPGIAADDKVSIQLAEVYPNPSTSNFRLYLSTANQQSTSIELYSIDGKKLQSKTITQSKGVIDIDASAYRPGIYLLNVKQGNFTKTIKLIKQ